MIDLQSNGAVLLLIIFSYEPVMIGADIGKRQELISSYDAVDAGVPMSLPKYCQTACAAGWKHRERRPQAWLACNQSLSPSIQ